MAADKGIVEILPDMLATRANPWSLCLVGDDTERRLQDVIADLTRPASSTGDGKRICSGFAYWGTEPTFAWARSCTDPLYPVMRESIESFTTGWSELQARLDTTPTLYVSFGPGTGEKDAVILQELMRRNPDLHYVPVDMSAQMLRLAMRGPIRQTGIAADRVLPVQLDFAAPPALAALRVVLERIAGGGPALYSLLGNTLANFDDDAELLRMLTAGVRSQDRFVLEAATADQLDERAAADAALEYRGSRSFREFATSAVLRHTDLRIEDTEDLVFVGGIEDGKALTVKVMYQNLSGRAMRFTLLSNRTSVLLPAGDTIRLYLSRKYALGGLKSLLADGGFDELAATHSQLPGNRSRSRFGLKVVLLSGGGSTVSHGTRPADDLWR